MDSVFLAQTTQTPVREQVFEAIRDAIVSLRLKPGDRLKEDELAQQLGVSKTPVREALLRLQQLDLVTIHNYRGAVVRGYDTTDIAELHELRELLEGACAREAAAQMTAPDLRHLQNVMHLTHQAQQRGHLDRVLQLLDQFDDILVRQNTNRRIAALLDALSHHMTRIGVYLSDIPGRIDTSIREHQAIVDAIEARNPDRAEIEMRLHVRSVLETYLSQSKPPIGTHDHEEHMQ